jgi:hypothetical protein
MAKINQPIIFRDCSRGTIRTVQNSIAPQNSVREAINLDTDKELGSAVSRLGTTIIGSQAIDGARCYGLAYFNDSVGTNHKLFGVFSDNSNNDIYDMLTGTKSLEDDNPSLKTRFCTFLDSMVRVNGTDAAKSYNGSAWVTTGGAFDEDNMPLGSVVIEWKDRVYTAGVASAPDILYYSSIADPDARTIVWTADGTESGAGDIAIEQEDGGGGITALEKVPGYLLIFKERTMKRWDGASTFPEDLINVGTPTQEAVCRGRGMVFFANQQGIWVTNGGYPKKISKPIQDLWDEITDYTEVYTYCDEDYVYIYVGDITLDGNTYNNVMFKYNIDSQTFDIYSYYNNFKFLTWYISSSLKVLIGGDDDGQALQIGTGYTDYPSIPISYTWEPQEIDLGSRARLKEIDSVFSYTENVNLGQLMYRSNSNRDLDWRSIRNITNDIEEIGDFKVKGNVFNFKITGTTDSGQVKIKGIEFPSESINIVENVRE